MKLDHFTSILSLCLSILKTSRPVRKLIEVLGRWYVERLALIRWTGDTLNGLIRWTGWYVERLIRWTGDTLNDLELSRDYHIRADTLNDLGWYVERLGLIRWTTWADTLNDTHIHGALRAHTLLGAMQTFWEKSIFYKKNEKNKKCSKFCDRLRKRKKNVWHFFFKSIYKFTSFNNTNKSPVILLYSDDRSVIVGFLCCA